MKILNWMHRKFTLRDEYIKKVHEDIVKDTNITEALLEKVDVVDIVDVWKGGLLTIGTLGFHPLQKFIDHHHDQEGCDEFPSHENGEESEDDDDHDYSINDDDEGEEGEYYWNNEMIKKGELYPLIRPTFTHGSLDYQVAEKAHLDTKKKVGVNTEPHLPTGRQMLNHGIGLKSENMDLITSDGKSKMRERITLADLFSSADANDHQHRKLKDDQQEWCENGKADMHSCQAKRGLSFRKKLIPRGRDESRPIHKLHQLMTRMLKRKVHPDVQGNHQKACPTQPVMMELLSKKDADSVSLLQTQDVEN